MTIDEKEDNIMPDLEEVTKVEKQLRRDSEEDDDIVENIATASREGDLSPRQIKYLENSVKKGKTGQPSLPLQVKTRSRDRSGDVSQ